MFGEMCMHQRGKIIISLDKKVTRKTKTRGYKHKRKNVNYVNVLLYGPG
jgi:hypothetical protein